MADWGDAGGMPGGWWGAATAGLGALGDLSSVVQNTQGRSQQGRIYEILSDPQKLAAYIRSLYQPMSADANTAVRRDLGAQWGAMTGGATGGALNQFIADALAKLETQRYQDAARTGVTALQGSLAGIPAQQPVGALGGVLRSLMALRGIQGQGGGGSPGLVNADVMRGGLAELPTSWTPEATQSAYQSFTPSMPALSGI